MWTLQVEKPIPIHRKIIRWVLYHLSRGLEYVLEQWDYFLWRRAEKQRRKQAVR